MSTNTKSKYNRGLIIFRRDYRLHDNTALYHAFKECHKVLPIFIFTKEQIDDQKNSYKSDKSVQFLIESLGDIETEIRQYGGKLSIYYGEMDKVITSVLSKNKIDCLYINADYTPYAKKRDYNIQQICDIQKVEFKCYHDVCLFPPGSILTGSGTVYQKFTPFYNECLKQQKMIKPLRKMMKKPIWLENMYNTNSISLNKAYTKFTKPVKHIAVHGGRDNALNILSGIQHFKDYGKNRNDLGVQTTRLSAYLKYGCISVREVFYTLLDKKGFSLHHDLIRQLIWRDFYIHILDANPQVLQGKSLKSKYDNIKWNNNRKWFQLWCEGRTGFPIVDAGMRQLNKTGYMHNRARLITASFLVKLLHVDWRWGEKYFAQQLVDYDPAANNGNWQWIAGSGADSQPYFRIFNPWSQTEKHDPECIYIKEWIHELRDVDAKSILKWDTKYKEVSVDYPEPIIDYKKERMNGLNLYKKYL